MPVAIATEVNADGFNGTAMHVTWVPVPQKREYAKGKILGYQVDGNYLLLYYTFLLLK